MINELLQTQSFCFLIVPSIDMKVSTCVLLKTMPHVHLEDPLHAKYAEHNFVCIFYSFDAPLSYISLLLKTPKTIHNHEQHHYHLIMTGRMY